MRFYKQKDKAIYLDVEEHEDKIIMTFHSDYLAQDFRFEVDGLTASEISHQLNNFYVKQVLSNVVKCLDDANKAISTIAKRYHGLMVNIPNESSK